MSKTLYINKHKRECLRRQGLDLSDYPSAGPYPSVTGMKKLYWGIDAYVVKSGAYIYNVPVNVYDVILNYV